MSPGVGANGAMFKTLDGTQVQAGSPAVAVGHDIFMMALKTGGTPLEVMTGVDENTAIGDDVVVLGNAEGAGVINTIKGKVARPRPQSRGVKSICRLSAGQQRQPHHSSQVR